MTAVGAMNQGVKAIPTRVWLSIRTPRAAASSLPVEGSGGRATDERSAMTPETREAWWVLRAQGGDREAFDALLAAVQEPLFGFVAAVTGDRSLAEDVLQEV